MDVDDVVVIGMQRGKGNWPLELILISNNEWQGDNSVKITRMPITYFTL